jgi:hypothetical protein
MISGYEVNHRLKRIQTLNEAVSDIGTRNVMVVEVRRIMAAELESLALELRYSNTDPPQD